MGTLSHQPTSVSTWWMDLSDSPSLLDTIVTLDAQLTLGLWPWGVAAAAVAALTIYFTVKTFRSLTTPSYREPANVRYEREAREAEVARS